MTTSLIQSFHIQNFMSLEDVSFSFDETNFINLKGYNDSGKSAVLRALEVAFFNYYKTKQASFIQDGKDHFRIVVGFTDGVSLVRYKYANGQSLYELRRGDDILFTTRQGKALGKVDDVPEPIQKYLNFTKTGDGYLNSRSKEDPRLLVDTTGSENFRAISNILQAESLFRALQLVKEDTRFELDESVRLRAELSNIDYTLTDLPEEAFLFALEQAMSDLSDGLVASEEQTSAATALLGLLESLNSVSVLPKQTEIRSNQLQDLLSLEAQILRFESQKVFPKQNKIDTSELIALGELQENLLSLSKLTPGVEQKEINTSELQELKTIQGTLEHLVLITRETAKAEKEMAALDREMHEMVKELGEGAQTVECFACGTLNLVGV